MLLTRQTSLVRGSGPGTPASIVIRGRCTWCDRLQEFVDPQIAVGEAIRANEEVLAMMAPGVRAMHTMTVVIARPKRISR